MPFPDRIVVIALSLPEWPDERELWIELCGVKSNITLVEKNGGMILECLSKFPENHERHPLRMPGRLFESNWQRADRSLHSLNELLQEPGLWPDEPQTEILAGKLMSLYRPMTPRLSKELALMKNQYGVATAIKTLRDRLSIAAEVPLTEEESLLFLNDYCQKQDTDHTNEIFNQRVNRLRKTVTGAIARCAHKIDALQSDAANIPDPVEMRERADLLASNFYLLRSGMQQLVVENIFQPGTKPVTLQLDPDKNAGENLKLLYKRAAKAERAGPLIQQRLEMVRRELGSWNDLHEQIRKLTSLDQCIDLENRLTGAGFSLDVPVNLQKDVMITRRPYLRFISPDGWDVWVGRNARENDRLSFKDSSAHDFWLHAKGFHGAHVIVKNPSKAESPPRQTIDFAAQLAARYSGARGEKAIQVFLTMRKHVRRVSGNHPGLVRVSRHDTITIDSR